MARDFAKAFYNSPAWHICREIVIEREAGLCQRCRQHGRVQPGDIVHHTVVLNADNINDPSISLNAELLMYVCKDCHEELHSMIDTGLHDRVCGFDESGQPIEPR